jgi:hypothetical protein
MHVNTMSRSLVQDTTHKFVTSLLFTTQQAKTI